MRAAGAQPGRTNRLTDTNLLLAITVVVFLVMYIGAMLFLKKGFLKPQTFFNILNANAALIITSCGMSLVMITGGIDISVGGVVALVSMSCAVYLDYHGGSLVTSLLIALGIGLAFGCGAGLSGGVPGYSALYRFPGRHVLRPGHDDHRPHGSIQRGK